MIPFPFFRNEKPAYPESVDMGRMAVWKLKSFWQQRDFLFIVRQVAGTKSYIMLLALVPTSVNPYDYLFETINCV
jgi:hypothetical protein